MRCSFPPIVLSLLFSAAMAHGATLVVANSNFSTIIGGAAPTGDNPASWTTVETTDAANSNGIYAQAAAGAASGQGFVLHFKDGAGSNITQSIQQSITTNNAGVFADTYSSYTVTLDLGWRNDLADRNDASYRISLIDTTDNVELAFQVVAFPVRATGQSDVYALVLNDASFTLSYDNTLASYLGDSIAIRIARTDADTNATSGNNFASTTWIDDIRLTAVPEPSAALLGGLGLLALFRRRR